MSHSKISSVEESSADHRSHGAYRYSLITAFVMAGATVAMLIQFGMPTSIFSTTLWATLVSLVALSSAWLIRRERIDLGLGLIFGIVQVGIIFPSIETSGLGIAFAAVSISLTLSLSYFMKSRKLATLATISSIVIATLLLSLDLFEPFERIPNTDIIFTWVVGGGVVLAYLTFIARRAWTGNLRNKLMVAFMGVMVVAAGALAVYVFISTTNILKQGLERELTEHTAGAALRIGGLFNEQISQVKTFALNEILEQSVEDSNEVYTGNAAAIQAELEAKDVQWRAADAADNNNDPLVQESLTSQAALELREFQGAFPNNVEIFITDVYGGLVGTTNRTSDYYQADEDWWQAAYNNGQGAVYLSEPGFDESARALAVQIASPVRSDETGEIIGILRTTYLLSAVNSILDEPVGETGDTELFFVGDVVSHFHKGKYAQVEPAEYAALQAVADQGMVEMDYEGKASVVFQAPVRTLEGNPTVDNLGWVVVFHQNQDEAFAPINAQIRGALFVIAIVVALAVAAAIGLSLILVRPISQLTEMAEEVAAGNLNSRAKVISSDEVGILASTFNKMTSQLQETLQDLEQRVAARTRDLQIVAEVGTATSTILESSSLLQEVVDLTKERFNLYHSHIYLLDAEGKNLVLAAGAGEPGRQMLAKGLSIPLSREQSLVARAAREREGVTVNDVTQAADFLPNPLLPNTRSELAVPMLVGGSLIGVFDIQSDEVGRFTDADVNIQTTMAAQLATSIQNVRAFEKAKAQAEMESLVSTIGQKIQRALSVDDTLQIAVRELGLTLGAARVSAWLGRDQRNGDDGATQN